MKNDFLNDDWLKQQLKEEDIDNDDFTDIVLSKVKQTQHQQKAFNYSLLGCAFLMITYFLITLLSTTNDTFLTAISTNESICFGATITMLALILSLEELEL